MAVTYIFDETTNPANLSTFDGAQLSGGGTVNMSADGWSTTETGKGLDLLIGLWTLNINGTIASSDAAGGVGLSLFGGTGVSTLKLSATGTISGTDWGLVSVQALNITNDGVIFGINGAISIDGLASAYTITNNNFIVSTAIGGTGVEMLGSGKHTFTNNASGEVDGGVFGDATLASIDVVINNGQIHGDIGLNDGADTLTNKGLVEGIVYLDSGNDILTNSGIINGDVNGWIGNDNLSNTGTITGSL